MTTLRRCCTALIVFLVLPLAGCFVVSLEPLAGYMNNVPAQPPAITGTWHEASVSAEDAAAGKAAATKRGGRLACTITFTLQPAHTLMPKEYSAHYDIAMVDEKLVTTKLTGQLVQLGPDIFLDVTSVEHGGIDDHLVPVHSFWKVMAEKDSLRLIGMKPQKMKELIQQPHPAIEGTYHDMVILTGTTEQLQDFVKTHANDAEIFDPSDALVMTK